MFANIGSNHGAHAQLASGKIAGEPPDVKGRDHAFERIYPHPFCLSNKARHDSGQVSPRRLPNPALLAEFKKTRPSEQRSKIACPTIK
jgi:hypothetical protein